MIENSSLLLYLNINYIPRLQETSDKNDSIEGNFVASDKHGVVSELILRRLP